MCIRDSYECLKYVLKIEKRGFRPNGNGQVFFKVFSIKKNLPALNLKKSAKLIKRIRGVAIISKVSTSYLTKMISKVREIMNDYIPDAWVYSEMVKKNSDQFFGLSLYTNT